jgi:hypothetical protein
VTVLRDTQTADMLWRDDYLPIPPACEKSLFIYFTFGATTVMYHFVIDAIDLVNKVVYVTLDQVDINGTAIPIP